MSLNQEMLAFAQYFSKGMETGSHIGDKQEARQLAAERNKIMSARNAATDRRENIKLGMQGQKLASDMELSKARAYRLLNPVARGGGGKGAAATSDPETARLEAEALKRGIIAPGTPTDTSRGDTINYIGGGDEDTGMRDDYARGGAVRKLAGGGSIEEGANMSIQAAQAYKKKKPQSGDSGMGGIADMFGGGKKAPDDDVRPTGPVGSGPGGSYTEADSQPGGILARSFQQGGRVPQAIDTGMSGPGNGFGQRASPPAGARRY